MWIQRYVFSSSCVVIVCFMSRPIVEAIVRHAYTAAQYRHFAVLFMVSYAFLLRVPSEALPMIAAKPNDIPDAQSVVYLEGEILTLKLRRRKNKPAGSVLSRQCTCKVDDQCFIYACVCVLPPGKPLYMCCPYAWKGCQPNASRKTDFSGYDSRVSVSSSA